MQFALLPLDIEDQLAPAFVDLYTPLEPAAYTVFEFVGSIAICESLLPIAIDAIFVQEVPPSVDLYAPSP